MPAETPIRVGVIGVAGKMGSTVATAVAQATDMELVAAADVGAAGLKVSDFAPAVGDVLITPLESFGDVDVAVDFTHLEASRETLPWLGANGIHAVVGSTGFTQQDLDNIAASFGDSNCLIAPNFAISAVLMMRFAEMAAPYFDTGEIIELHHDNKLDAPSGTAMQTAERMASVSDEWGTDPTKTEVVSGARGGKGPGGIGMHSVRMRGMVAHQEVILGAEGQTLTIRQDSYDRTSFMPGVLLGIRRISDLDGLTIGLDSLL